MQASTCSCSAACAAPRGAPSSLGARPRRLDPMGGLNLPRRFEGAAQVRKSSSSATGDAPHGAPSLLGPRFRPQDFCGLEAAAAFHKSFSSTQELPKLRARRARAAPRATSLCRLFVDLRFSMRFTGAQRASLSS